MTVCLLLAAGSCSRMGKAKMLLPFRGKTLLQHTIDEIKNSAAEALLVVTGYYHKELEQILSVQQIKFVENKNWEAGMGNSIQTGVKSILLQYPGITSIIIALCDQPFISSALVNDLIIAQKQTGKGIVASAYNETIGTPALFSKIYFDKLVLLQGQYGAKKIIEQHYNDVALVNFPKGAVDIDTEEDYKNLLL